MTKENLLRVLDQIIWFSLCGFAFFSPWSIAGAQSFLILGLVGWLVKMIVSGRIDFVSTPLNLPILLYLVTQVISVIFSPLKVHSLLALKEEWLLLLFFLIVNNVKEEDKIGKLVTIIIAVSCLVGLYAIWQHYSGMDLYRHRMLDLRGGVFISTGLFGHHLTFGGYYMLVFLLALVIVLSYQRKGILRILDFAAPVIIGLSLVFSYARSAWLGVVMGILTFGYLKGRKFALYLSLSMIILLLAVFAIEPTSWDRIKEISLSRDKDKAETTRIRLWQTSINMIKDKPIWGIGPGNFGELFDRYKVEGYFDNNSHPHNDFLNITVNSGLLGFFTYMGIWIAFLYTTIKVMIKKKKAGSNSWMQIAGLAAIISFLFAGLLQCYYSDAEVNMLVMFILGITVVSNLKTKENIPG